MKQSSSSDMMEMITIDIETTMSDTGTRGRRGRSVSNPHSGVNYIVALGAKVLGQDPVIEYFTHATGLNMVNDQDKNPMLLVGHNFAFDLGYLRYRFEDDTEYKQWMNDSTIWDTQIAEYVLTGQRTTFGKLDDIVRKRAIGSKAEVVFKAPEGAAAIPKDELENYLKVDLELTEALALEQMEECSDEQFNLIIQMGETLKAVAEMQHNGMKVDTDLMVDNLAEIGIAQIDRQYQMNDWLGNDELAKAKPEWYNSPFIMSAILFGGTVKYTVKEPAGLFKTGSRKGTVKYRNVQKEMDFPGMTYAAENITEATKKRSASGNIVYKVDEDTILRVQRTIVLSSEDTNFLRHVLETRVSTKIAGTYYTNMLSLEVDGVVHHTLNQTATSTGRLSCTKPNLQNVPMPEEGGDELLNVKACFPSRYSSGVLLEVDFKQLEVCALAWFTRDPQLLHDVASGVDIHAMIAGSIGWDAGNKNSRRAVKTVVFAMMYGAGAKGIAKDSGLPKKAVAEVMKGFYDRYGTVKEFFEVHNEVVSGNMCVTEVARSKDGDPIPLYVDHSPTGRTYLHKEDQFRPSSAAYTTTRNYPIQGVATGDIVPVVLGQTVSVLYNNPEVRALMVNTTHDSITFDCVNEAEAERLRHLLNEQIFNDLPALINEKLPGIKWNVPLEVAYERGSTWATMKVVDKFGCT